MSIQKLGNHTYFDTAYNGANLGCIDTERGLVLVDTPFIPDEIDRWRETVTGTFHKEIAYVINTHHHFDHLLGNHSYCPNVIAHQSCYEEMTREDGTMLHFFVPKREDITEEVKQQIYRIPIRLPNITFDKRMWLQMGDVSIELFHVSGHTESSIYTYVIEDKVLFTGDVFVSNSQPYMGQSYFKHWVEALKTILGMDVSVIAPGHGEVRGTEEVERMLGFFDIMMQRVAQLRKEGTSRDSIIERVHDHLDYYPLSPGEEHIQTMLFDEAIGRLYDQMESAAP
jgi:cyclase